MTDRDSEMQKALEADGEKLRQLTGEDHGPFCPACLGSGVEVFAVTVYEHGCGFSHASTDERPCPTCDGFGMVGWVDPGEGIRTEPCPDCTPKADDDIVF